MFFNWRAEGESLTKFIGVVTKGNNSELDCMDKGSVRVSSCLDF